MVCPLLVARFKSFLKRRPNTLRWLACGFLVAVFIWSTAFFYLPGLGFTYLLQFGSQHHSRYLPEVKAVNHYEMPDSPGYDSQWYVQIALHPHLKDPVLAKSVDSLPYRARRILFEWTAWALGGGDPWLVMNLFALQNIIAWFILAVLLFRWFPPTDWGNWVRWGATLFSFGLIFSVRGALLDGPGLLLTAIAMALLESNRPWAGAAVMAVSGLGKDTSILCGTALPLPDPRKRGSWAAWLGRAALLVLPLAAWMLCLRLWLGRGDDIGDRNFSWPFVGLAHKAGDALSSFIAEEYPYPSVAKLDLLVLVGLVAQFLFFAFRIRWRDAWWRVGATYAVLMVFLGDAVWEHYPSAAARVLLPMTLAFNIRVPRRGFWVLLLVVGNLGIFGSANLLKPPGRESYVVEGPRELRINPVDGKSVEAVFGARNWWGPERSRWEFWRWSMGDCSVALHNPHPFTLVADIRFALRSADRREAILTISGKELRREQLDGSSIQEVVLKGFVLPPGDTVIEFRSNRPPAYPGNNDKRRLTFSVRGFEIDLKGRR